MTWNMRIKRNILLLVALGVRLSSASSKEAPSTGDTVGKDDSIELELQDAWGDRWWPWAGGAAAVLLQLCGPFLTPTALRDGKGHDGFARLDWRWRVLINE